MPTKTTVENPVATHYDLGISGPFKKIGLPGCFVLQTGDLLRVPEDALAAGRSPTLDIVSNQPWTVTKISADPYLPVSAARAIAADMDLRINF